MRICAQWWPARTQTPREPMISATSCGCTPATEKDRTAPRAAGSDGPCSVTPSSSPMRSMAYVTTSSSWARTLSIPSSPSQSTAAPRPMTSAMADVPASNFVGTSAKRTPSLVTEEIMCPPPSSGGSASSAALRPCRIPTPVGP
jgi:hypothetical protein